MLWQPKPLTNYARDNPNESPGNIVYLITLLSITPPFSIWLIHRQLAYSIQLIYSHASTASPWIHNPTYSNLILNPNYHLDVKSHHIVYVQCWYAYDSMQMQLSQRIMFQYLKQSSQSQPSFPLALDWCGTTRLSVVRTPSSGSSSGEIACEITPPRCGTCHSNKLVFPSVTTVQRDNNHNT